MSKPAIVIAVSFIIGFALTAVLSFADVYQNFSQLSFLTPSTKLDAVKVEVAPQVYANSSWGPADDPIAGTVLVIAAHVEPLDWLQDQPFKPVIMVKGQPAGTPNNLVKNWGREASSYLQFILEHYDDLPPRMIFVHGHNESWHMKDIVAALNVVDPMSYTYAALANMFVCFRADFVTLANCWEDAKAIPWLGTLPVEPEDPLVGTICCATFLVTKERVLSRSKEFYQWLMDWIMSESMHDSLSGRCMEWMWHKIFGNPWRSYAIDPTLLCPKNPEPCSLAYINQAHP